MEQVFSDPTKGDTDADGLPDDEEFENLTDPGDPDTDADGRLDGLEVAIGTQPLRPDIFVAVTYSLMQLSGPQDGGEGKNDWAYDQLQSGTFMTRTFQLTGADGSEPENCSGLVVVEVSVNCIGEGKGMCRVGNPCAAARARAGLAILVGDALPQTDWHVPTPSHSSPDSASMLPRP